MLKRGKELGLQRGEPGIEVLERLVEDAAMHSSVAPALRNVRSLKPASSRLRDSDEGGDLGPGEAKDAHPTPTEVNAPTATEPSVDDVVLLAPQLRTVLGFLGILVTTEVIEGICACYPVAHTWSEPRWDVFLELAEEEQLIRAEAKQQGEEEVGAWHKGGGGSSSSSSSSTGSWSGRVGRGGRAEGKSADPDLDRFESDDKRGSSGGARADHKQSKAGDDMYGDELGTGPPGVAIRTAQPRIIGSPLAPSAFMEAETGLAANMTLLLEDIRCGRGLKTLDLSVPLTSPANARVFHERFSGNGVGLDPRISITAVKQKDLGLDPLEEPSTALPDPGGTGRDPETGFQADDEAAPPMGFSQTSSSRASHIVQTGGTHRNPTNEGVVLPGCMSIRALLRARRTLLNQQDIHGTSPLLMASALDNPDAVGLLVRAGADIALPSRTGETALSVATGNATRAKLQVRPPRYGSIPPNGSVFFSVFFSLSLSISVLSSTPHSFSHPLPLTSLATPQN